MAIVKTELVLPFHRVHRGTPFAVTTTLYTLSEGKEDPKEHILFKANNSCKAKTVDKRINVHILPDTMVTVCHMEKKTH